MKKIIFIYQIVSLLFISFITITAASGQVIVIHGISSSGKTSIMQELAVCLKESNVEIINWDQYMRCIIDQKALQLGYDLNDRMHNWDFFFKITEHFTELERQSFLLQMRTDFVELIKQTALHSTLVLVDTIKAENMPSFLKAMGNIKVTLVLIYTPLNQLIKFIESRNNATSTDERNKKRSLLVSLIQYQSCFKPVENAADIVVDTFHQEDISYYLDYMDNTPWYREKPKNFEQNFLTHFKLDQASSVKITPIFSYDIIVFQSELPAIERAQMLKQMLKI